MHKPEVLKKLSILFILIGGGLLFCGFLFEVMFQELPRVGISDGKGAPHEFALLMKNQFLWSGIGFFILGLLFTFAKILVKRKYRGHSNT